MGYLNRYFTRKNAIKKYKRLRIKDRKHPLSTEFNLK
jgi:hypothetical protein